MNVEGPETSLVDLLRAILVRPEFAHLISVLVPKLLTLDDFAKIVGVPVATVYSWRSTGVAPPMIKVGKHLRVDPRDVADWLDARREAPVSTSGLTA